MSLAYLIKQGVAAPIVGATKIAYFEDACKVVDLDLTNEESDYLEELYEHHTIVGALPEEK